MNRPAPGVARRRKLRPPPAGWSLHAFAGFVLVVGSLYLAQAFLVPISIAVLLSLVLQPVVRRLERWHLPRVLSVLVAALLAAAVVCAVAWIVAIQLLDLVDSLPSYRDTIRTKLRAGSGLSRSLERAAETIDEASRAAQEDEAAAEDAPAEGEAREGPDGEGTPAAERPTPEPVRVRIAEPEGPFSWVSSNWGWLNGLLAAAGMVIVLVIFILIYKEDVRDRIVRLISQGEIVVTTQVMKEMGTRISRYLLMTLVVNVTYGMPVGVGLYLLGIPNAVLWGLLATVLRFIPFLGPIIAATPPILLSFAAFPGWDKTFSVVGLFVVLELISNNVVEPLVYGRRTGMAPIAVIVAALFWTWLWGPVGLLLAVPLTTCLAVAGAYVPQLGFLHVLLADEPQIEPRDRFYQRLVSLDAEGIEEVAVEALEDTSLIRVYDDIVIPSLGRARREAYRGILDQDALELIVRSVRELVGELNERVNEELPDPVPVGPVVCIPARDDTDRLVLEMLARRLAVDGIAAEVLEAERLIGEVVDEVGEEHARVVCVGTYPQLDILRARYLVKRLRARLPKAHIVACLWSRKAGQRHLGPMREAGADHVAASLEQAVSTVQHIVAEIRASPPQPA